MGEERGEGMLPMLLGRAHNLRACFTRAAKCIPLCSSQPTPDSRGDEGAGYLRTCGQCRRACLDLCGKRPMLRDTCVKFHWFWFCTAGGRRSGTSPHIARNRLPHLAAEVGSFEWIPPGIYPVYTIISPKSTPGQSTRARKWCTAPHMLRVGTAAAKAPHLVLVHDTVASSSTTAGSVGVRLGGTGSIYFGAGRG